MRIMILNWRDIKNPLAGGSEIYFHELAKRWVKQGNEVVWICSGWKGCRKKERIDGIEIIRVGNKNLLYLLTPLAYSRAKKPDVLIDVENGIPFFSPLFSKSKIILHIHHLHRKVWFKELNPIMASVGWLLETKLMPLVYRNKSIITISKSSAKEISEEGFGKIAGIVEPGIEMPKYNKLKKSKIPSILFLNRIKKYKGIKTLLDAIAELKNHQLIANIAGAGDYLERMKSYSDKLDLNDINFLGKVSENKKRELMQKSWIFVNPSFKEGWGIVNIEANYFGTPVIGSDVTGIKDSIIDGRTGLLFNYGDSKDLAKKIDYLISNDKLRKRMSKEGIKWAHKFDWDSKANEYYKILSAKK